MIVLGIDVALVNTGVAAIEDGRATWRSTIEVEGDPEETGPRYALLRRSLERLLSRMKAPPAVVAIEQPELGIRKGHGAGQVLKLYGAFAVCFAECARLWPRAKIVGVTPQQWKGTLDKGLTARMMTAKYGVREFANTHEADALGLADMAWDYAKDMSRRAR